MRLAIAEAVLGANANASSGCFLLIDSYCVAHILHRIVEATFRLNELIPSLHATAYTASRLQVYAALVHALRLVVTEDLATDYFPHTEPNPEFQQHSWHIIEMTLLRGGETRGRDAFECPVTEGQTEFAKVVHRTLNGDWRRPRCQHFCTSPTCCDGFNILVAIEKVLAIVLQAWFGPLSKKLPSQSRWHTFAPALQTQAGGHLCHQILPRVLDKVDAVVRHLQNQTFSNVCLVAGLGFRIHGIHSGYQP
jgi:hypothetical protein